MGLRPIFPKVLNPKHRYAKGFLNAVSAMDYKRYVDKSTQWKSVDEFDKTELEKYKHGPETELAKHVCDAAEDGEFLNLQDYLMV